MYLTLSSMHSLQTDSPRKVELPHTNEATVVLLKLLIPNPHTLNNNEINSNLNNKVSETTYTAITESRLRAAKIISQIMPNLAKVYLENTGDKR